jgi:hypothetical protein
MELFVDCVTARRQKIDMDEEYKHNIQKQKKTIKRTLRQGEWRALYLLSVLVFVAILLITILLIVVLY